MEKLFVISFALFVLMVLSVNYVAAQENLSPLKQLRAGIAPSDIVCHDDLKLVLRPNGNPSCVKSSTSDILSQKGWIVVIPTSELNTTPSTAPTNTTEISKEDVQDIVDANNRFMLDFYSITSTPEENSFFSPWSMLSAFSVLYEGARGQTADEISSVFYLPKDDSTRRSSFESMQDDLNVNASGYELRNANALWIKTGFGVKDDFINTAKQYYDSKVSEVDFPSGEPIIDSWVENQTNNKIKDLVKGKTNDLTQLVITNAIYFKGTWETQFDANQTREDDFRVNPDQTIKTSMMHISSTKFAYAETDDLQVLSMPYEDKKMSMLVLLPKNNNLESLEKSFTVEKIKEWQNSLHEQKVIVFVPKFKLETKYELPETMSELGMKLAFDKELADLSGIADVKPFNLYVQFAIHKAFVDVNEEGTEAAAATGIGVGLTSVQPSPPVFRADHPFLFLIQDNETGLILFMGKVVDPTK